MPAPRPLTVDHARIAGGTFQRLVNEGRVKTRIAYRPRPEAR